MVKVSITLILPNFMLSFSMLLDNSYNSYYLQAIVILSSLIQQGCVSSVSAASMIIFAGMVNHDTLQI
jgi:hypothetical protein